MAVRNITNARSLMEQARSLSPRSLNILKFPDDLEKVPHKMLITIRSYSRSGAGTLSIPTGTNTRSAVALPVPFSIIENYSVNYQNENLGIIGNAVAGAVDTAMSGGFNYETAVNVAGGLASGLSGQASGQGSIRQGMLNIGQALAFNAAASLTSTAGSAIGLSVPGRQAIAVGAGAVFNPHTTAVFQNVNLRNMTYNWTLAPKTEKESRSIEQIVRILRNAMLPRIPTNELFLRFPDQVEYKILGADPDFDMPTAPCVINELNLDRTGSNSGPAFFAKTGAPVVYKLELKLTEIRALTRNDFIETPVRANDPLNSTPTQRYQLAQGIGD